MNIIKVIFLLGFLLNTVNAQQVENLKTPKGTESKSKYSQDILSFASDQENMTRVDVFIQVPYTEIQFLKTNEGFTANYLVTISVFDENKEKLIVEKSWNEKLVAKDFQQTVNKTNFNLSLRSFNLTPGKYFIRTAVEDKDSKKEHTNENIYSVRDLSSLPSVSDIMLIARQTYIDGSNKIVPNVSSDINAENDSIKIFFEIYGNITENVSIEYSVRGKENETLYTSTEEKKIDSGRNQVFSPDTAFESLNLGFGRYNLIVTVKDENKDKIDEVTRVITSKWAGIPSDPEKAIAQLIYIATPSEMDHMEDAESEEEKIKRYREFWRMKDPTPNTEENELYNEYARRVAYANENFSHYIEGWRSDRGMVFIILGSPNNVDRHPFDLESKPYEVWQYYELNRNFVFVDETGFGDYRLVTPLYGDDYRFRN
jgi:GWxTD domain-containing protein